MAKQIPENERKAVTYCRLALNNLSKAFELTEHDKAIYLISHAHSDICDIIEIIQETEYEN